LQLPVVKPNTRAAITNNGYVLQNGVKKMQTAAISIATLFNIKLFTLFKSARTPEIIRPIVLVIPANKIKTSIFNWIPI
jgi:hypothetical protein